MAAKRASSEDTRFLGRLALAFLALFLLGFYVAFGRLVAGSWRQFAALALAATTYLAGTVLLARLNHLRTAADWSRKALAFPVVGAIVGGMYVFVSTASGVTPVLIGFVWGVLHAWLLRRQTRKLAAEARAREEMTR
jgi:hypothetical protein